MRIARRKHMTVFHTQNTPLFGNALPAIAFAADETWTIGSGVMIASSGQNAVFGDFTDDALLNNGMIAASGDFEAGVSLNGAFNSVSNAAGASITGNNDGIFMDGAHAAVDNHGTVFGLVDSGVVFFAGATASVLTNSGWIFGKSTGLHEACPTDGGLIHNLGRITSDDVAIKVETDTGVLTTITNDAGATINGTHDAIAVDFGNVSLTNLGTVIGAIELDTNAPENDVIVNQGRIAGTIFLGSGDDVFAGTGGISGQVLGEAGNDRIIGGSSADGLFGGDGNDRLSGAAGNDELDGGFGNDTLIGGTGRDRFIFASGPNPARNLDRINDFAPNVDKIVLADSIFTHLGADGVLAASHFHSGPAAADASDRIIYNANTGFLFYDADGTGRSGPIHFATLAPHLTLHGSDFLVGHFFIT
jgi:Ca2+-binding RTX toxin-like protein